MNDNRRGIDDGMADLWLIKALRSELEGYSLVAQSY